MKNEYSDLFVKGIYYEKRFIIILLKLIFIFII